MSVVKSSGSQKFPVIVGSGSNLSSRLLKARPDVKFGLISLRNNKRALKAEIQRFNQSHYCFIWAIKSAEVEELEILKDFFDLVTGLLPKFDFIYLSSYSVQCDFFQARSLGSEYVQYSSAKSACEIFLSGKDWSASSCVILRLPSFFENNSRFGVEKYLILLSRFFSSADPSMFVPYFDSKLLADYVVGRLGVSEESRISTIDLSKRLYLNQFFGRRKFNIGLNMVFNSRWLGAFQFLGDRFGRPFSVISLLIKTDGV
jgi:hypothetical protein